MAVRSRNRFALAALLLAGCVTVTESPVAPTPTSLSPEALTTTASARSIQATAGVLGTQLALTATAPARTAHAPITAEATATSVNSGVALPSETPPAPTTTPTSGPVARSSNTPPGEQPPASTTPALAAPAVFTFTVSPAEINPGESVTLTWRAAGEHVVIYSLNALGQLTLPTYDGPLAGSLVVTTTAQVRNQAQYVAYAISGDQSSPAAFATARVRCPDTWFFSNPPTTCPGSLPHTTTMQAEYFEHGLMLWMQWNDRIIILYSDGASPAYQIESNQWFAGMPESDPDLTPPAGLYQPVRGFGVAWRTGYLSPIQVVRDRIGWATSTEFGVPNAAYQCDSAPKYVTCFISGPEGVTYLLKPERSGWETWTGP